MSDVADIVKGNADGARMRLPIPDYEGCYEIDTDGRVYSLARTFDRINRGRIQTVRVPARELARCFNRTGYPIVMLHKDGQKKTREVHRLVCRTFHGEPPFPTAEAAHDNGIRADVRAENVAWKTRAQNHADKRRHGTLRTGSAVPTSKLSTEQAQEICRRALRGGGIRALGREFDVDEAAIRKIRDGKMWADYTIEVRTYLESRRG